MKKSLVIFLFGALIGIGIGAAGMLFLYPFIFPPPTLNEQVSDLRTKTVISSGAFSHPNPSDPVHWGKGGVTLYSGKQDEIFLNPDFEVGPGPDYFVYLSTATGIRDRKAFESAENLEKGKLKSFTGSQVYSLPDSASVTDYKSVVIWCKTFGQLITSADLLRPE